MGVEQITQVEAEAKRIEARVARRCEENRKDEQLLWSLRRKVHAARLRALVGVPLGVKLAWRVGSSDQLYHLNDARGTLEEVRRTRATVQFNVSSDGVWNLPLDQLRPATEEQGMVLEFV